MVGAPFIPIEQWRGYGWSGLPFQSHPAEGIVLHHAVIEPSGDIVADLNLVDGIHTSLGGFAYTDGAGYGINGGGRGPFIGAHTYTWNHRALGYVFLTDGRFHALSYSEIEAFRWQRQWWVENGWVHPEHFVTPHGWMPNNSTACCGPLIIEQLHELLLPYEGSFEPGIPGGPPMIQQARFRAATLQGATDGKVYAWDGAMHFHIIDPEHWTKLVNWNLVLNYDAVLLRPDEFAKSVDLAELRAGIAAIIGAPPSGTGGLTEAQARAIVRGELDKTVVRHDDPVGHLGT